MADNEILKEISEWDQELAGELGSQPPFKWIDEEWLLFAAADRQIAAELEMSRGVAKRTLRELCAKGDVRSIVARQTDPYEYPVVIEHIKLSEWVDRELDLECNWLTFIMVSVNDLEHWLGKQPNRKPQEKLKWFHIDKNSLPDDLRAAYDNATEAHRKFAQHRMDFLKEVKKKKAPPERYIPRFDLLDRDDPSDWINFHKAAEEIGGRLSLSQGTAEKTLRDLCASGDIRSVRYEADPEGWALSQPELIRPSEWLRDQIDLGDNCVDVNEDDLKRWLDKQATKPGQQEQKALGKRPRIKVHLAKLYPEGVPDPAFCNRKELQGQLLKIDPKLLPLDDDTLKKAVDEYNAELLNRSPSH